MGSTGNRTTEKEAVAAVTIASSRSSRITLDFTALVRVTCARGRPVVVCACLLAYLRVCVRSLPRRVRCIRTTHRSTTVVFTLMLRTRRSNAAKSAARRYNPLKSGPPARPSSLSLAASFAALTRTGASVPVARSRCAIVQFSPGLSVVLSLFPGYLDARSDRRSRFLVIVGSSRSTAPRCVVSLSRVLSATSSRHFFRFVKENEARTSTITRNENEARAVRDARVYVCLHDTCDRAHCREKRRGKSIALSCEGVRACGYAVA